MAHNKLALAAGLLSAFLAASPLLAADTHAPANKKQSANAESAPVEQQMPPLMTVKLHLKGAEKPSVAIIGDRKMFRAYIKEISHTPGARIELDGSVLSEKGDFGYISLFEGWDFSDLDFSGATIKNAILFNARAAGANFNNATLQNVMLAGIYAPDSTWRNVVFDTTDPAKAVRGGGCIEGAQTDLSNADFTGGVFTGMNWGNTNMDGATLPPVIKAAVRGIGDKTHVIETNFEGASLKNANMRNISISGTSMAHADISGADLQGAKFSDMGDMNGMIFDKATKLSGTEFIRSVPPYPLIQLKERQEKEAASPQILAWRPGR